MARGGKHHLRHQIGLAALATCLIAAAPARANSAQSLPAWSAAAQARDMTFAVPLIDSRRALGDVLVQISSSGQIAFESQSLRRELQPLLNDAGRKHLDDTLGAEIFIGAETLAAAGFTIRFDQNRLELVIESIDGRYRPVGTLGMSGRDIDQSPLPTVSPADFSAFVNLNGNFDYVDDRAQNPELYIFGATRYKNAVLEIDGAFSDQFGDSYRFYRRSIRGIYDFPDKYQRVAVGDLQPETLPLLRTPYIGGISFERRRQTFQPFLPASRLGGREIFLDSSSTVDVLVNGQPYQSLQLDAGRYDLANLPLQFGSNDVQLVIRDAAGREQTINYDYFFEPLELEAGDFEYVVSVGAIARELSFEPNYSNDIGAVGYYRRALNDNLLLGGGVQLSKDLQVFGAESIIVPQVIPGVFDLQLAMSTGNGTGFAMRGGYRLRTGNDADKRQQFTVTVDYQGRKFQTLDELIPSASSTLSVSASYTRAFSINTFLTAGLTHTRLDRGRPDRTVVYGEVSHRLDQRFRVTGGVEYGDDEVYRHSFGVRLGVTMVFGGRHRGSADYRSRTETFRANFGRGADNHVGSWGYDVGFTDSRGDTGADASVDYNGNRFEARASVFSSGDDIGSITDRKRARLQVGTSLAFADGTFGIGRPITDSFAVARPHSTLKNREVITGRSLSNERYYARSGFFGAAVQSDLTSYSTQNIQYDIAGLDTAYDIGDGVARVHPPFHSGYKVIVGNNRYVSAVGNIMIDGKPLALATGRVTSPDDEGFENQSFFTNSAGRFGIIGLAPGKTYLVSLAGSGRVLTIKVPESDDGLLRMGTIDLPAQSE